MYRNPDSGTSVSVFVDGRATSDFELAEVDPGHGWEWQDWRDARDEDSGTASPAAAAHILALYDQAEENYCGEFITKYVGDGGE